MDGEAGCCWCPRFVQYLVRCKNTYALFRRAFFCSVGFIELIHKAGQLGDGVVESLEGIWRGADFTVGQPECSAGDATRALIAQGDEIVV